MTQAKDRCTALLLWLLLAGTLISGVAHAQGTGEFLCSKGTRDGLACESDEDCVPDGVCVIAQGVCDGGEDDGALCDCPSGTCAAQPACAADTSFGTCSGGTSASACCDVTFNCAGNRPCRGSAKVCLSGEAKGFACLRDSQCPSSVCRSTGKFCAGACTGGQNSGTVCVADDECPGSVCTSDFQNFACVNDVDCCVNSPCPTGICQGVATEATPTRTRGTTTPTRTRTVTPTRSGSPGTATSTPVGGGTATPTPSATRTGSPVSSARLVSSVTATDSSISVDNANSFPNSGTALIDSEQIAYTDKFGNTLLNVRRGVNGTTAAAHVSGALVRLVSSTVPTPARATPTEKPRGVVYQAIGEGGGCALHGAAHSNASALLVAVGLVGWVFRRRYGG